MRKDKLGKLYDRFDPDERFRLVLEAAARGDKEDMEWLRDPGIKRNGRRCTQSVKAGFEHCYNHDPSRVEERKRAASYAGKAKASKATKHLHDLLEYLTRRVIEGELETYRGAVANQLIGTRIRLLEYERRLKELEEFEARIEELQQAYQKAGNRWQA
jgi:hypothetical protein